MKPGRVEDQFDTTSGGIPVSRVVSVDERGEVHYTYFTHPEQAPEVTGEPLPEPLREPPSSGPLGGRNRPPRDNGEGWFNPQRGEDEQRPWADD